MPKLEREVCRYLNGEFSGHDPWHAFRVRDLAIRIAQAIGADTEVVHAAALLHDIGHLSGRAEHAQRGADLAADLLSGSGFPADKVRAVITCIEHHHWLPGRAGDPQRPTVEYQAFADADRLDALGAIGIARTFAFGGAHSRRSGIRSRIRRHTGLMGSLRSTTSTTSCSGCLAICILNWAGAWQIDVLR